jgi:hypothetical protein
MESVLPQLRTYRCAAITDAMCHKRKSTRLCPADALQPAPGWPKTYEMMSPEELAEEKRGWDRHRHKQQLKRLPDGTLLYPDSPKKSST